jgi:predicted dehydrogenase
VQSIAVVGLGQQAREYIDILKGIDGVTITAVCDSNRDISEQIGSSLHVKSYSDVHDLANEGPFDVYFLCLPHSEYLGAIKILARSGVHFIKEKPFASSLSEAQELIGLLESTGATCSVLLRRRFNPAYQFAQSAVSRLGEIYSAEFRYTLAIARLDEGWRASRAMSGGGALIDMGYHLIDLLVWFLGVPDAVTARTTATAKPEQIYDVEDTAHILVEYEAGPTRSTRLFGNLLVSRSHGAKDESVRIVGTEGVVVAGPGRAALLTHGGAVVEEVVNTRTTSELLTAQLSTLLADSLAGRSDDAGEQLMHHLIVEAAYQASAEARTIKTFQLIKGARHHEYA